MNEKTEKVMLEYVSTDIILKEPEHWTARVTFVTNPQRIFLTSFIRLNLKGAGDPMKTLRSAGFGSICSAFQGKDGVEIDQQFYKDLYDTPPDQTGGPEEEHIGGN